jgi:hypothetical protein
MPICAYDTTGVLAFGYTSHKSTGAANTVPTIGSLHNSVLTDVKNPATLTLTSAILNSGTLTQNPWMSCNTSASIETASYGSICSYSDNSLAVLVATGYFVFDLDISFRDLVKS